MSPGRELQANLHLKKKEDNNYIPQMMFSLMSSSLTRGSCTLRLQLCARTLGG